MQIHSIDPITTYIYCHIEYDVANFHQHINTKIVNLPTKKKITQQLISQINASTPRVLLFTFN